LQWTSMPVYTAWLCCAGFLPIISRLVGSNSLTESTLLEWLANAVAYFCPAWLNRMYWRTLSTPDPAKPHPDRQTDRVSSSGVSHQWSNISSGRSTR
jgi:hypothetical protein